MYLRLTNMENRVSIRPISDVHQADLTRIDALQVSAAGGLQRIELAIQGMSCASCVGRVERALTDVPGVIGVTVNLATERADIEFESSVTPVTLADTIKGLGYTVPDRLVELSITGMHCASCVGRVEHALADVPGVTQATVNLATERASVAGQVDNARLVKAIEHVGYQASIVGNVGDNDVDLAERRETEASDLKRSLLIALLLGVPVFVLEMGSHVIPGVRQLIESSIGLQTSWLIQFALTTAVLVGPGRSFYTKGLPALMRGAPDMNSLVAVGTLAAYLFSVVATFLPSVLPAGTVNVYFEAAVVIVALILLGRYLEVRARGRTSEAIQRLIGLQVKTASVLRDGVVIELPVDEVVIGDVVRIHPGERIPLDGEVCEGSSYIDESMITGEPIPVSKSTGDAVTGGTVNQSGALTARITAIGESTMLSQIIRMVEQAQSGKLPIQALVDRITLWFVPAVMAMAALTFGVWMAFGPAPALSFALVNAVAVLIIACPCAMGLATPTSIMVGTGRGAQMGVLFRKGEALQRLKDAQVVAFDKTGTLTEGRPQLTDLELIDGFERNTVLARVAAVEARSEHPIARAIVSAAENESLRVPEACGFDSLTGLGVQATVEGVRVQVGADRYMEALGLSVAPFENTSMRLADEGKSPLYAAIDGKLCAIIAVADPIKDSTPQAIAALRDLGVKVVMITGDNSRTASAIARTLGIDEVVAEVLPDGKIDAIKQLKQQGVVAFVGDGINDAPALAEADIGLAIGTGTDIAIEAADVVLISGNLTGVHQAIALSRATIKNIQQNLFWAFAYNTLLIPVAAGALYPGFGILLSPMFAAGAMALSSVFVLSNALRLRRFKLAESEKG